jgi:hypothetical protein
MLNNRISLTDVAHVEFVFQTSHNHDQVSALFAIYNGGGKFIHFLQLLKSQCLKDVILGSSDITILRSSDWVLLFFSIIKDLLFAGMKETCSKSLK